jgi:hypothetical protein
VVITKESEEGVENAYQEMVSLAFDLCSHLPGVSPIESLIVPQARLYQMPTISARLSFIQRQIEWLKTLEAKSAMTNSQRQYCYSANAEPMQSDAQWCHCNVSATAIALRVVCNDNTTISAICASHAASAISSQFSDSRRIHRPLQLETLK